MRIKLRYKYRLKEEQFKVGKITKGRGIQSTVTDVEPTTGSVTWDIKNIPAFDSVFKEFEELKLYLDKLDKTSDDEIISNITTQITKLFNQYRTHIRKNYAEFYKKFKTNESSTTSAGGEYQTPFAFKDKKDKTKYRYKLSK